MNTVERCLVDDLEVENLVNFENQSIITVGNTFLLLASAYSPIFSIDISSRSSSALTQIKASFAFSPFAIIGTCCPVVYCITGVIRFVQQE